MFPLWDEEQLEKLLNIHGTPDEVALFISSLDKSKATATPEAFDIIVSDDEDLLCSILDTPVTLQSILNELKGNLNDDKVKLKVDQEDLLNDAMAFYKDPEFNRKDKLRVIFNKQPAADTGGVDHKTVFYPAPKYDLDRVLPW